MSRSKNSEVLVDSWHVAWKTVLSEGKWELLLWRDISDHFSAGMRWFPCHMCEPAGAPVVAGKCEWCKKDMPRYIWQMYEVVSGL